MLMNPRAQFPLAQRLRRGETTLGEVFTFLSGLYFRGKMAYALRFTRPPRGVGGVWVITTNRGLMQADAPIDLPMLESFGQVGIDEGEPAYVLPLTSTAQVLRKRLGKSGEVVLLGSIATGKYVDILQEVYGGRLLFPEDFIGRGDMSRGGLMLRRAAGDEELVYIPVEGAVRRGRRPPKLGPRAAKLPRP
jgi:hypothetical protein